MKEKTRPTPAPKRKYDSMSPEQRPAVDPSEVAAYCPYCHDFEHAKMYWVECSDDGRWGHRLLYEKCKKCDYKIDDEDVWYGACFRCCEVWCKWCTTKEAQRNFKRLYVDHVQKDHTNLWLGPMRGQRAYGERDFYVRGKCLAGRFCEYMHDGN